MVKERHKIVPASYLVLIRNNKILLQRRFNTGYEDGKYSFVAGHVDKGETFTEAIIREVKEEAGIILEAEDLSVVHVMNRDSNTIRNNGRIDVFFVTKKWTGNIENKEPNKCDDLSWFDLDNMPDNIIPYIKEAMNCIKNKVVYSEFNQ